MTGRRRASLDLLDQLAATSKRSRMTVAFSADPITRARARETVGL